MSDDDLKIVEENNEFKRRPDDQRVRTTVQEDSQNDVYSLRSEEDAPSVSILKNASRSSANDVSTREPSQNAKEPDVYEIAEPIPSPALKERQSEQSPLEPKEVSAKSTENKRKASKSASDDSDDDSFSLEEIYRRKREERASRESDAFATVELPPTPPRPFLDGIFKPFLDVGFIVRALASIGAAYLPLCLAVHFLDYSYTEEVREMLERNDGLSALTAFYDRLWKDKVIVSLLCLFWGVFAIPFVNHVFLSTATGSDKIDEWPEYNFISGLGSLLLLALYVVVACVPGAALFKLLGLPTHIGGALSALCLTPIFILSSAQNDAPFAIVSKGVLVGVKRLQREWLQFWGISALLLLVCLGIELFAIWHSVDPESVKPKIPRVAVSALIISCVVTLGPCLYARYLGRFAWILETDYRKRQEEEQEEESDKKNREKEEK